MKNLPQLSNLILYAAYSNYYIILGFNTQEYIYIVIVNWNLKLK